MTKELPEDISLELRRVLRETASLRSRLQKIMFINDKRITKGRAEALEETVEHADAMVRRLQDLIIGVTK